MTRSDDTFVRSPTACVSRATPAPHCSSRSMPMPCRTARAMRRARASTRCRRPLRFRSRAARREGKPRRRHRRRRSQDRAGRRRRHPASISPSARPRAFPCSSRTSWSREMKAATRLHKTPLKSAGFRVLRAPDVPSVLVELGYVSNRQDLQSLLSDQLAQPHGGFDRAGDRRLFRHPRRRRACRRELRFRPMRLLAAMASV